MQESVNFSFIRIILFLIIGGIIGYGYYILLYKSLQLMKKYQRKGLFLFFSTLIRFILFILLTLLLTQCQVNKFIWYILGFMLVRLFAIHHIKKGNLHG